MTLRQLVSRVLSLPVRPDIWARLIGYAVILRLNGWIGVVRSSSTKAKLRADLRALGLSDIDELEL